MIPRIPAVTSWLTRTSPAGFSAYCIIAAFGTYFCMFAFRKPFTAGTFEELSWLGIGFKTILIVAQVAGYALAKFWGIQLVSEMPPRRRAVAILFLIAVAEMALLLFPLTPMPWNAVWLFINGIPLGMIFGLVLAYLEGRQLTEALAAGLCASFIVASGVTKSVGHYLLVSWGLSEFWMPAVAGALFLLPMAWFVCMLEQIPQPNATDIALRSVRPTMSRKDRWAFFRRHIGGLSGLMLIYLLLSVMRSIRDDFAVEIWRELGHGGQPAIYSQSEVLVMLGVIGINGASIFIRSNRRALLHTLLLMSGGFFLVLLALGLQQRASVSSFVFMVLIGLGTYIPYVAFHTTIFERLIAAFRESANVGYLMYLADTVGYFGYIGVMLLRNLASTQINYLQLFLQVSLWIGGSCLLLTCLLWVHFRSRLPRDTVPQLALERP